MSSKNKPKILDKRAVDRNESGNHIQNFRFVRNFGGRPSDREFWAFFSTHFWTKFLSGRFTLVTKRAKNVLTLRCKKNTSYFAFKTKLSLESGCFKSGRTFFFTPFSDHQKASLTFLWTGLWPAFKKLASEGLLLYSWMPCRTPF